MNQLPTNLDPEKIKKTVEQLRQSNRQLDLVVLSFDELISRVDRDIRSQVRNRIQLTSDQAS